MRSVVRSLGHPLPEYRYFLGLHRLGLALGRLRHQVMRVFRFNPPDQFARVRMPRHNRVRLSRTLPESRLFQVKPEVGLAHFRIGTMATKAVAGQYWLHILIEIKMLLDLRHAGMVAAAAHGGRQQGCRYYRRW